MRKLTLFLAAALLVAASFGAGANQVQAKDVLTAASGGIGGTWFAWMTSLAEIIRTADSQIELKTVPGSGLANPVRVNTNEAHIAWGMPTFVQFGFEGKEMYKEPLPNIRGIATGFGPNPIQFFVTRDSNISSIEEIIQKKIPIKLLISAAGRVDNVAALYLLDYYGLSIEKIESWGGKVFQMEYSDETKMLKDRQANALITMFPHPAAQIQEVMIARPLKGLKLDPNIPKVFQEKYSFTTATMTPNMYGGKVFDEEMVLAAIDQCLIVNKAMSEELAYRLTRILDEQEEKVRGVAPIFQAFHFDRAWKGVGCPLHPGAEKYYREKGLIQ